MSQNDIKFAYWVPNVSGGLVVSKIEQRTSWDIDYNRKLAQTAEKAGFEYALSQIRFTAGYGAEYQHESVAISHALLASTEKLRVIAAILPGPWHPAVLAKQISTISHLTNGRIAVNIVSGWFRGEFTAIGEPWLEHDERYRRSEEFIDVLRGIWTRDDFNYCFLYSNALERFSQNKMVGSCNRRKRLSELGNSPETIRMLSDTVQIGAFCFLLSN